MARRRDYVTIQICCKPELKQRLEERAKSKGLALSKYCKELLEEHDVCDPSPLSTQSLAQLFYLLRLAVLNPRAIAKLAVEAD